MILKKLLKISASFALLATVATSCGNKENNSGKNGVKNAGMQKAFKNDFMGKWMLEEDNSKTLEITDGKYAGTLMGEGKWTIDKTDSSTVVFERESGKEVVKFSFNKDKTKLTGVDKKNDAKVFVKAK